MSYGIRWESYHPSQPSPKLLILLHSTFGAVVDFPTASPCGSHKGPENRICTENSDAHHPGEKRMHHLNRVKRRGAVYIWYRAFRIYRFDEIA